MFGKAASGYKNGDAEKFKDLNAAYMIKTNNGGEGVTETWKEKTEIRVPISASAQRT
jgi:hypothetical protein